MRLDEPQIFRFFGWNTQGDLGPYTMYTSRRAGLVIFLKAPPKKPPSTLQIYHRNRMRAAARLWTAQPKERRQRFELATKRAHLRINGFHLWIYYTLTGDTATIRTIERQTGLQLTT